MTTPHVTAREARRLRWARNEVRNFERNLDRAATPERVAIIKARWARAITLLTAHRLSGQSIRHDPCSQPLPIQ